MAEKRKNPPARQQLQGFSWQDEGNGRAWKLVDAAGAHAAEIVVDGSLWRWSVIVPTWYRTVGNPSGKVKSLDDAKAVCEAILNGTILDR